MGMSANPLEQLCYGPIVEKELRVLSRLKRYYVLRCAYILVLALMTLGYWGTRGGNVTAASSRMGAALGPGFIWLQFVASQLVVIILLSAAINREVSKRTLGELMSTPMTGLHIAWGKLLSHLIPAFLILSMGFPLLALLRVFGGLSWDVIVSSLCVTLTAMVFSGSLTLLLSVFVRQPFGVVCRVISLQVLWMILPSLLLLWGRSPVLASLAPFFTYTTPLSVLRVTSNEMAVATISWSWHCAIMVTVSLLLLICAAIAVRRIGIRQALGERIYRRPGEKRQKKGQAGPPRHTKLSPVRGPALIWKEVRLGRLAVGLWQRRLMILLTVAALCTLYGLCAWYQLFAHAATHAAIITGISLLGLLRVSTNCAMSIPRERETQTWPVLLATPQTDGEILLGKGIGALCLTGPLWLLLICHLTVFIIAGYIHPAAPLFIVPFVSGAIVMVGAWGLYVGSRCQRASTAAAIVVVLFILSATNFCCPLPTFLVSPLFLMGGMVATLSGRQAAGLSMGRILNRSADFSLIGIHPYAVLLLIILLYLFLAWVCLAFARRNIRKRIFRE